MYLECLTHLRIPINTAQEASITGGYISFDAALLYAFDVYDSWGLH